MLFLISTPSSLPLYDITIVCLRNVFQIHIASILSVAITSLHKGQHRQCTRRYHPISPPQLAQRRAFTLAILNKRLTADRNQPMPAMALPLSSSTSNMTTGGLPSLALAFLRLSNGVNHTTNTRPNRLHNRNLHKFNGLSAGKLLIQQRRSTPPKPQPTHKRTLHSLNSNQSHLSIPNSKLLRR